MEHVRWHSDLQLRHPVMIAGFTGWNDAADAASTAVRSLIEGWGATLLASIDPEEFTDFSTIRPHVRLTDDMTREIVWPQVAVWAASTSGGDVLLVLGPEPSFRWRTFCEQLLVIARRFDTTMVLTLGALLADVSHTRSVQLIGTASDPDLIDKYDLQRSRYEGPTGIVGVLHDACGTAGIPTASLWAATPAYAREIPSPKAALALIRRASDMIGTAAPIGMLASEISEYEDQVEEMISTDDDLPGYVRRLERMADDDDDEDEDEDEPGDEASIDVESGDQLIEELEQFLRDQGDGPG
ncbi:MAG: PAC2 family protein [Acidimicrobiia bacterium]